MTSKIDRNATQEVLDGLRHAAEEYDDFDIGDIVGLRSFGAKLTVIGTDGDNIEVAYFDGSNVLRKAVLPADAVKLLAAFD